VVFIHEEIFTIIGIPQSIIIDGRTDFTSRLIRDLMEKYKIKHMVTTPYHSQDNKQVKWTKKILEAIITKIVILHLKDWADKLHESLCAYRMTWRNIIVCTPYELVYGKRISLSIET